jgi:hypothetical protein
MPETLQAQFSSARARWKSLAAAGGVLAVLSVLGVLSLIGFHTDRLLALSTPGRAAWLILLITAAAAGVVLFVLSPMRRSISDEAIAVRVEQVFPEFEERLLSTVELAAAGPGISSAMVQSLAVETERVAKRFRFSDAVPTESVRRNGQVSACVGLALAAQFAAAPQAVMTWVQRIVMPGRDIPVWSDTRVWALPENGVLPRGEDAVLKVRVGGRLTDTAVLHYRFEGGAWNRAQLRQPTEGPGGTREFSLRLSDVQQNISYYAMAGDGRANPHQLTVSDRPTLLGVKMRLNYPAHTGKAPQTVSTNSGNIVAPVGTTAEVEATSNNPILKAQLIEEGSAPAEWKTDGNRITGTLAVKHDKTLTLRLTDINGFDARPAPQFTLRAQPDAPPVVVVDRPGTDIERTARAVVNMAAHASDDYGISSLTLRYTVGKRSGSIPLPVKERSPDPGVGGVAVATAAGIELGNLHLKPGDSLTYFAAARDNDNITGPNEGRSAVFSIRIISDAEMRERLDTAAAAELEALKQLIERQKEAQRAVLQAAKTGRPEKWEEARQQQRSIAGEIAELSRKMAETTSQMRENQVSSPQKAARRDEMQRALDQLAKQEAPKASEAVDKAAQDGSNRSAQQAAAQQEVVKQALERMMDEGKPAEDPFDLARQAREIAQDQQTLADRSDLMNAVVNEKGRPSPEDTKAMQQLAKQQQALRSKTQELMNQVQKAAQNARDQQSPAAGDMQKAAAQAQQNSAAARQQQAEQNLNQGRAAEAGRQQTDAAQDLRQMAKQLEEAGNGDASSKNPQNRSEELEKAADRLKQLANQNSTLARQMNNARDQQAMNKLAEQQEQIRRQAAEISKGLNDVPSAQQNIGNADRSMQRASENLQKGQNSQASPASREATSQLLRAAQAAQEAASNLSELQQTREAQKQIAALAKEQRDLEARTRQLDAARKGTPTPQQAQELAKQAEQQKSITERTRQLGEDMPSQGFKWAAKEAERKMEAAKRGLERQNSGADTRRNQNNAAQTLERIARSLEQHADALQQESESSSQQSTRNQQQQQQNQAAGDLQLAREMQAQITQETSALDQRRKRNPNNSLSADQQRELNQLAQAEREVKQLAEQASRQLRGSPEISKMVQGATDDIEEAHDRLREEQTDRGTQGKQESAVRGLDMAIRKIQQQQNQQRQQMAQQRQQGRQPGQQPGQQSAQNQQQQPGGSNPDTKNRAPVVKSQLGTLKNVENRGRAFGQLSPRNQQNMREGRQEKVPAEYRELVNQYTRALGEKGK